MMHGFQQASLVLFYAVMAVTLIASLAKGGAPERAGCAILLTTLFIESGLYVFLPQRFTTVEEVALLVDVMMLVGFGWLALHARRRWPMWAAAFQLVSVASHIARSIKVEIDPMAYSIMKSAPTGMAIIALAIGTINHVRRMIRYGDDPAWVDWEAMRSRSLADDRNQG